MATNGAPGRIVVWEHLCWGDAGRGLEHLVLRPASTDATVLWVDAAGAPNHLEYRASWGRDWMFERVRIAMVGGDGRRELELVRTAAGEWTRDGDAARDLTGCTEVDVWPTPFTNTLPIRRLNLRVGESADITVAWVRAPELTVAPRAQRYTRTAAHTYRFLSLDDGFEADIVTDGDGLVVDYPKLFRRVV